MNYASKTIDKYSNIKGALKQKWSRLTEHDLDIINDSRDKLVEKIVSLYGYTKEEIQNEINKLWAEEILNEEENIYSENEADNDDNMYK